MRAPSGTGDLRTVPMAMGATPPRPRLQYAVIHLGRQSALHVVQLYGHAGGTPGDKEANAQLILRAAEWLAKFCDVP